MEPPLELTFGLTMDRVLITAAICTLCTFFMKLYHARSRFKYLQKQGLVSAHDRSPQLARLPDLNSQCHHITGFSATFL
jgi:hypothetical protein